MTSSFRSSRARWLGAAVDALMVAAVLALAYQLASRHLARTDAPTLIDWELKPAVMYGCGFGFVQPSAPNPDALQFLQRKRGPIACRDFAWGSAPQPALSIAQASRYSLYGAGLAMRAYGVSWETLDWYLASLYAVSMAFTYGLFRMALGRALALGGTAMVACSLMIHDITVLRDFVKLPCFTGLWLVLGWLIRGGLRRGAGATFLPMAVAGVLLGIGIGLRMDALIFLPVFVATTLLVIPGFTRRAIAYKFVAAVLFAAMFMIAGRPILTSMGSGSNSAHVVVLGLTKGFDGPLSVEPAPYDIGAHYADGYAYNVIVSDAMLKQGKKLPILLGTAPYDQAGGQLLRRLAARFPGDVITRALGATAQVFRFQFEWRLLEGVERVPVFRESAVARPITESRTWLLSWFADRELMTTMFVLALAGAFNWRLGALGLLLILYFCGYAMLQFSRRHAFHLDIIPLFVVMLAIQLPLTLAWRVGGRWREDRAAALSTARELGRSFVIGLAVLLATAAAAAVALGAARSYQQRSVASMIDETLAARWEPVPIVEEPLDGWMFVNGNVHPSWYEIYHTDRSLWQHGTLLRAPAVVPAGTEAESLPDIKHQYFRLTFDNRCGASDVVVATNYSGANQTTDSLFTRSFTVPTAAGAPAFVLVPGYYHLGSTWNRLDGFGIPESHRACLAAFERVAAPSTLPEPVLSFALAPDWRERPLYQRLLDRPRLTILGTAVDPLDYEVHYSGWRRTAGRRLRETAPPLDEWQVMEGVNVTRRGDVFHVAGNTMSSGYQVMSPPFDVAPGATFAVQIVGSVDEGEMCVGVLDGAQRGWLLPPSDARTGLLAPTGEHTQVRVVFSNCANPPGAFTVRQVSYETFRSK